MVDKFGSDNNTKRFIVSLTAISAAGKGERRSNLECKVVQDFFVVVETPLLLHARGQHVHGVTALFCYPFADCAYIYLEILPIYVICRAFTGAVKYRIKSRYWIPLF